MTLRLAALLTALAALLAACAAPEPPRAPVPDCARPADKEQPKDGGLGGTGNAPDPCARPTAGS